MPNNGGPPLRFRYDARLPPLPGHIDHEPDDCLETLLEELVDAAGLNIIPSPASEPDPPSLIDMLAALKGASSGYAVGAGISLADHFWTHGAAVRNGEVAARLRATARIDPGVQGFVACYATEIRTPLLYSAGMSPLRVRDSLSAPSGVEGPFLVLIACELQPNGQAEPIAGYASPVYHARRFLPVRHPLDRDVLRALEHLQVSLDAHGCASPSPIKTGKTAALSRGLSKPYWASSSYYRCPK